MTLSAAVAVPVLGRGSPSSWHPPFLVLPGQWGGLCIVVPKGAGRQGELQQGSKVQAASQPCAGWPQEGGVLSCFHQDDALHCTEQVPMGWPHPHVSPGWQVTCSQKRCPWQVKLGRKQNHFTRTSGFLIHLRRLSFFFIHTCIYLIIKCSAIPKTGFCFLTLLFFQQKTFLRS